MKDLNIKKQNDKGIIENIGALIYYLSHERHLSKCDPKSEYFRKIID